MKKTVLSLICILVNLAVFSQIKTDTVYVSTTSTAYLAFPDEPNIVEIGNKALYVSAIDGKTVFIKAKVENAAPSTYMVKVGDNYYLGVIQFKSNPTKMLYDFRNIEINVTTTTTVKAIVNPKEKPALDTAKMEIKNDLISFKAAGRSRYKTFGTLENGVYFGLSDLSHNSKASFVKMKLSNQSSVAYVVDHVTFEIYENKVIARNELTILIEDCPRQVGGKEEGYMYFALPLLSIPENCEVKVTLRERNGLRTISCYIPAKVISQSSTF